MRVHHQHRDQASLGGNLAVLAQPADVTAIAERPNGHSLRLDERYQAIQ